MSRIKELKENPHNSINIVSVLELLCPPGETKYVETLLRIIKSTTNLSDIRNKTSEELFNDFQIKQSNLTSYSDLEVVYIKLFLECFDTSDIKSFQKFCDYNEKNLIRENDLSRYKSFKQIEESVQEAQYRVDEKEMEQQINKLFENDEWIVLKPLTHKASLKYGANTKWCTASKTEPGTFDTYAAGILIYSINKKTGLKVAAYKKLTGSSQSDNKTVVFYNSEDTAIDSLSSGLPIEILGIIKNEIDNNKQPNTKIKSKLWDQSEPF